MPEPVVVAFGGGVNSTALLIGLLETQRCPDLILFADTGGEKPETYAFLKRINRWLRSVHFPSITYVANDGIYQTLENECLSRHTLPSLAFGWRSCSDKYKKRPQDKFVANWPAAQQAWANGEKVVKLLGIDAGEAHRAKASADPKYRVEFPLVEWDWGRDECVAAIHRAGVPVPPKSACFFCPASTKAEIAALAREHPDLFERAVAMEDAARPYLTSIVGLGRRFSWKELPLIQVDSEPPGSGSTVELPCNCSEG